MRKGIHPDLHPVTFICACGESFKGTSTKAGDIVKLDICSKCHPFFTGNKATNVDITGRAEKFNARYNRTNG